MNRYLEVAIAAARAAEKVILSHYGNSAVRLKDDQTIVTVADTEAEKIISSVIRDNFPTRGILGEETGSSRSEEDFIWIIDPIDGTNNYARSIPLFGTQIALVRKKEILVAVSNMPALNEMLCAESGKGAFFNDNPLHVSDVAELHNAYMAYGGISHFQEKELLPKLALLEEKTRGHRGFGDCWMYHLLAQGKVDIVLEAKVNIWDIAAVALIVKEAGGRITDLEGMEIGLDTTSTAATNGRLHAEVLAALK